jgi:HEPN domain-containing protein
MKYKEKIEYWIDLADYDFETAKVMLLSNRFLYVGFMCHQCIEKALKALYVKTKLEAPPKIHSLSILIRKIGLENDLSDSFIELVDKLDPLNIEARYPTYKDELFKSLTKDYCQIVFDQTSELLKWIKTKL